MKKINDYNEEYKYFCVTVKMGHLGRLYYIPIDVSIRARSGSEAAQIAKNLPRVKRNHRDSILGVKKISFEQAKAILEANKHDPYLQFKSRHEQNLYDLKDRLVLDPHYKETHHKKCSEEPKQKKYYKNITMKNYKKYRNYHDDWRDDEWIN